ncbi:MAG: 4-(cytidine 5'-diphospho)-2-C-methyl-D-erythritol kinase [Planctomycetaceae bacterium]|nr:4-(cytidine 5'-diphospho)-2-C-methyl-D-erythritol kinase [Planctomycetaceae bacterium]
MCQWLDRQSVLLRAPAKLNLHLEVLGRRTDGFHDLETVMVKLDLHDTLLLRLGEAANSNIDFRCHYASPFFEVNSSSPPPIPTDSSNLVIKAARLLQTTTNSHRDIQIELTKRIPVQAGLGGGSSDAAATLVGLNELWGLNLSIPELEQLAAQLGSDVPFFINTHTAAICRGRGEQITPISVRGNFPLILAQPKTGLSTPAVFNKWSENYSKSSSRSVKPIQQALTEGKTSTVSRLLFNALQVPAEELNSQLMQLTSLFRKFPVPGTLMTGSGSCCFGICHSFRQAASLSPLLRAARIARVCVTSLHHKRMHHGYHRSSYQTNG